MLIISPDGTRLVYYSGTPARPFTRRLDETNAKELPGTEGDAPFFSPDSRWIGIIGGGTRKVSVEGGAVIPLANVAGPGASWAENGDIFAGLTRIPVGGGDPIPLNKQTGPKRTRQIGQFRVRTTGFAGRQSDSLHNPQGLRRPGLRHGRGSLTR